MDKKYIVELGLWHYNMGILGFHRICQWANEKGLINLTKDNYKIDKYKLEFGQEVLSKFPEIYQECLIEKFLKPCVIEKKRIIENQLQKLEGIIKQLSITEDKDKIKQMNEEFDTILNVIKDEGNKQYHFPTNFKFIGKLKNNENLKQLAGSINKKDKNIIYQDLKQLLKIITEDNLMNGMFIKYIKEILKNNFYGQSIFCNNNTFENFNELCENIKNKIDKHIALSKKIKNNHYCDNCGEGYDIRDFKHFDTSMFNLIAESENQNWNISRNKNMICPICRMIYLCIPFGCKEAEGKFIFINNGDCIEELIKLNNQLDNIYKLDFSKINILNSEYIEFKGAYGQVIPTDNKVKIYKFNKKIESILRTKAEAISKIYDKEQKEELQKIIFNDYDMDNFIQKHISKVIKEKSKGEYYFNNSMKYLDISVLKKSFREDMKFMNESYNEMNKEVDRLFVLGSEIKERLKQQNREGAIKGLVYKLERISKLQDYDGFLITISMTCVNLKLSEIPYVVTHKTKLSLIEKCAAIISGLINENVKNKK